MVFELSLVACLMAQMIKSLKDIRPSQIIDKDDEHFDLTRTLEADYRACWGDLILSLLLLFFAIQTFYNVFFFICGRYLDTFYLLLFRYLFLSMSMLACCSIAEFYWMICLN